MAEIKVRTYMVGAFGTNCYFITNEKTAETLIVDPGAEASMLEDEIRKEQLKPIAVLLTHGHLDHASGAEKLANTFGIKIYAHELEKETLENPGMNLTSSFGTPETFPADVFVKDGEHLSLAGFTIEVLFTPGHTPGGCCYYFKDQGMLFCGDTLFCQSIGRTDFPGGSSSRLIRSIREKLMGLPEEVAVYPGHMEQTSIGTEKTYNPFL